MLLDTAIFNKITLILSLKALYFYAYIISVNDNFTPFFFFQFHIYFLSFSCLITLARTSSKILNKIVMFNIPTLFLNLGGWVGVSTEYLVSRTVLLAVGILSHTRHLGVTDSVLDVARSLVSPISYAHQGQELIIVFIFPSVCNVA